MSRSLENSEIRDLIPHRYPFLLIDRVLDYEPGQWIKAVKNVTANEPFFEGHFPTYPVMPGVLIVEALAQTAGILTQLTTGGKHTGKKEDLHFLAGVNNARFKSMVFPGDQLVLECQLIRHRLKAWKFECTASVGNDIACQVEIMNVKAS